MDSAWMDHPPTARWLDAYLADGLANNGGPTQTFALQNSPDPSTTSADPALDVVPASFTLPASVDGLSSACSVSDQRGVSPRRGPRAIAPTCCRATNTALNAPTAVVGQNTSVTYTATVTPVPDGGTISFDDGDGEPGQRELCCTESLAGHGDLCGLVREAGERSRYRHLLR